MHISINAINFGRFSCNYSAMCSNLTFLIFWYSIDSQYDNLRLLLFFLFLSTFFISSVLFFCTSTFLSLWLVILNWKHGVCVSHRATVIWQKNGIQLPFLLLLYPSHLSTHCAYYPPTCSPFRSVNSRLPSLPPQASVLQQEKQGFIGKILNGTVRFGKLQEQVKVSSNEHCLSISCLF